MRMTAHRAGGEAGREFEFVECTESPGDGQGPGQQLISPYDVARDVS